MAHTSMAARGLLWVIRRYQRGGGSKRYFNLDCNFTPTCSQYTAEAIERFGARRGLALGWGRICRCNDPDCVKIKHDPCPIKDV